MPGDGGDTDELEAIRKLGVSANKSAAGKTPDMESADSQLARAEKRLYLLEGCPQGAKPASRDEVRTIPPVWKKAATGFRDGMVKLEAEVSKIASPEEVQKLRGDFERLRGTFDPNAFNAHIALIVEDGVDASKAKASREEALRIVRSYRKRLDSDPLVRHVWKNPLVGEVRVGLSNMYKQLRNLDLNIQRCI